MRRPRHPELAALDEYAAARADAFAGLSPAEQTKLALLRATLEAAVPLWVDRLRRLPFDAVLERARACGELVAGPAGADILYRSTKAGATAAAFNALAEGVACLALAPGGVKVFGLRFEALHPKAAPSSSP